MRVSILGLGRFGMFLARHLLEAGFQVFGWDISPTKRQELEGFSGVWQQAPDRPDVVVLALFPDQVTGVLLQGLPTQALLVNLSSVQAPGIAVLRKHIEIGTERIFSFHPLFGPVGVVKSGWVGKQIVVTLEPPNDQRVTALLETFVNKGVVIDRMSSMEHDHKMRTHALAFFLAEFVQAGAQGADPRYLTGSARHMLGLLEFTADSPELRRLILSNPALKQLFPKLKKVWDELAQEFGWE